MTKTAFESSKFKVREERTIVMSNNIHPFASVFNPIAFRIPGLYKGVPLFYIRSLQNGCVLTYRPADRSVMFYKLPFKEFKKAFKNGTLEPADPEVFDVPEDADPATEILREYKDSWESL